MALELIRPHTQLDYIALGATMSECGRYRYTLSRRWAQYGASLVFVMLNPSTADGAKDDPTIKKCVGFARRHGYTGIMVVNLFAWRATDPTELKSVEDPVGPQNDARILEVTRVAPTVVAAWGAHPIARERALVVRKAMNRELVCLGEMGQPQHPLFVPYARPLRAYWDPTLRD